MMNPTLHIESNNGDRYKKLNGCATINKGTVHKNQLRKDVWLPGSPIRYPGCHPAFFDTWPSVEAIRYYRALWPQSHSAKNASLIQ